MESSNRIVAVTGGARGIGRELTTGHTDFGYCNTASTVSPRVRLS